MSHVLFLAGAALTLPPVGECCSSLQKETWSSYFNTFIQFMLPSSPPRRGEERVRVKGRGRAAFLPPSASAALHPSFGWSMDYGKDKKVGHIFTIIAEVDKNPAY